MPDYGEYYDSFNRLLVFSFEIRHTIPLSYCNPRLSSTSKHKAVPPDTRSDELLTDASDLKGVGARAVKQKSSGTGEGRTPPSDITSDVQFLDASDLEGELATAVKHTVCDTSKRNAPSPDTTTSVQLADASDLKIVHPTTIEDKSSGTSKRKTPPPDTTAGVQFADASDLEGEHTRVVKHKSSGTNERGAPPPNATFGVQLADASVPKGIYPRAVRDKSETITEYKYEPRFTPPREEVEDGTTRSFNRLSLGEYHSHDEAKIMLHIAHFYYDKDQGCVELDDGQFKFFIPPMSEQERRLAGEANWKWVTGKLKQVYAELGIERQKHKQLSVVNKTSTRFSPDRGVSKIPLVSSTSALEIASFPTPLPPYDVADMLEVPSCPTRLPPCDVANDYCETFSGLSDMMDKLWRPQSPNFLPQQSSLNCEMHFLGFGQILEGPSSPQADGVVQFIQGSIDPLSPHVDHQRGWDLVDASGSNFFAKPREAVLQQLVHRQKQQLEVYALRIVALEHQLCESQIQKSMLQQENERLKSQFTIDSLI